MDSCHDLIVGQGYFLISFSDFQWEALYLQRDLLTSNTSSCYIHVHILLVSPVRHLIISFWPGYSNRWIQSCLILTFAVDAPIGSFCPCGLFATLITNESFVFHVHALAKFSIGLTDLLASIALSSSLRFFQSLHPLDVKRCFSI
jgi:hypothetical protein